MLNIPSLEDTRTWVGVQASSVSDEDLQQILNAELAIQARLLRIPEEPDPGPIVLSLDGQVATITATGGKPGALYRIAWGDTYSDEIVLDETGAGQLTHEYADPGTYRAVLYDAQMHALGTYEATVPGSGTTAAQATYPDALARALLRRVQGQVAKRNLPLGMVGDVSEYGPSYMRSRDPEVNRLEDPYRIAVVA